jgi:hypothetical protein
MYKKNLIQTSESDSTTLDILDITTLDYFGSINSNFLAFNCQFTHTPFAVKLNRFKNLVSLLKQISYIDLAIIYSLVH